MTREIKRTESSEETESTTTASRQHSEDSDSGVNLSEREKEVESGDFKENYREGETISGIGRICTFYVYIEPVSSYLSSKQRQRQLYSINYFLCLHSQNFTLGTPSKTRRSIARFDRVDNAQISHTHRQTDRRTDRVTSWASCRSQNKQSKFFKGSK